MDADKKLLEFISQGQDATAPSQRNGKQRLPLVEVIVWPAKATSSQVMEIVEKVREVVCNGRVAAVQIDDEADDLEWTEEMLGLLTSGSMGDCSMYALWQSMYFIVWRPRSRITNYSPSSTAQGLTASDASQVKQAPYLGFSLRGRLYEAVSAGHRRRR